LRSSDITIRRLVPDDVAVYRELRLRGLKEHPDAFTSAHDEEVAKPPSVTAARLAPEAGGRMWGAFVDGTLVGAIGLLREPRVKIRHKGEVFGMYVARERAGQGVGSALLAHLIGEARRVPDLAQLTLTVTETNVAARRLYEKFGFRSFGIEPRAIRVGDTHFDKNHMILFLAQP
jgi:ribosomal protein S18 acetylase RimI-like enzyme